LAPWKGYAVTGILSALVGGFGAVVAFKLYASPTVNLNELQKMVAHKDYDGAVPQLRRFLRREPTNARAHLILAGAFTGQENHAAALEHLRAVPDQSLWGTEARFREGLVQLRPLGYAAKAEALWLKCLELDESADSETISPMAQAATVELLTLYIFQHRKRDAREVVLRWHRRATPENRGRAALALLALEFGPGPVPSDLLADLEKWTATDPNDEASRRALGRAYVELASKEEAGLTLLKGLIEKNSSNMQNWIAYMSSLVEQGDVATLRSVAGRLPEAAARDVECWQLRGIMHEMSQEWPEAADCFIKGIELEPSRRELHSHLAFVSRRGGNLEHAEKFDKSSGDLGSVEDQLHVAYEQLTITQARPVAESAFLLGDLYEKRGRFDEARIWYEDALRLNPNHAAASEGLDRIRAAAPPR